MMRPLGIKLFWMAGAVLLVAVVGVGWLCPWLFPSGDEGNLYRRYEHNPHLAVTFLKNYPVNDTLSVDVTTIQATDDEGWILLKEDFGIPELPELFQQKIERGEDKVSVRRAPRNAPNLPIDTTNYDNNVVVAISRLHQTIDIFHTKTESEQDAVSNNQLKL